MNGLPQGYRLRHDGLYEKKCQFMKTGTDDVLSNETLVRDRTGKLIAVERSAAAIVREERHRKASTQVARSCPPPVTSQSDPQPR
jgi:hypothetical protein